MGERSLHIPPLDSGRLDPDGRRVFTLTATAGTTVFTPGRATPTWGFNGSFLGPTLRASRGDEVLVRVRNTLPEPTTVHWHGMHLPARADGGPHQPIPPGALWEPTWTITQPAATLWYHPHPHGINEDHIRRGLLGAFLLDDPESAALGLPDRYGVDDIPVVLTDRTFAPDGAFVESGHNALGLLGDTLLVNGTVAPHLDVTTEQVRLRLLNGSTARCYRLGLADERPVALIATDSGLLDAPRVIPAVTLSPGERAEVVVTLAAGERVLLCSTPQDLGAVGSMARTAGGDDTFDVLELRAAQALEPARDLPSRLSIEPAPTPSTAAGTRRFLLTANRINGLAFDMTRVDAVVTAGTTEVWEVTNGHSQPHNFHVHDARFQVLHAGGSNAPAGEVGWKDTVYIPPRDTRRLLVRFGTHPDPESPYMFHCHLLHHENQGMMGQFLVVAPGTQPSLRLPLPAEEHGHG